MTCDRPRPPALTSATRAPHPGVAARARARVAVVAPAAAGAAVGTARLRAAVAACLAVCACGQFVSGTVLFNESIAASDANLTAELEALPALAGVFAPSAAGAPVGEYIAPDAATAGQFTQNVIFDPCRYYGFACCNDTFGTPEYLTPAGLLAADGSPLDPQTSRRPDDEVVIDERCTGDGVPLASCVMDRVGTRPFPSMPLCWNYNGSVHADSPCRAPSDGSRVDLCMEVGITQTAYIVECGGAFADDAHCGTFLEVHRRAAPPAAAAAAAAGAPAVDEKEVLGETRLRGMYTSGYRMSLVSTTYKGAPSRVICWDPLSQGLYELWWIQRTLVNFVVQARLPFAVATPLCDWDAANNRYLPYASLDPGSVPALQRLADGGHNPYRPSLLRFTRPRTEGDPSRARPGRGMGASVVAPGPSSYPLGAVFIDHDGTADPVDPDAYTYLPDEPLYTIHSGFEEPPNVDAAEYDGASASALG